MNSYKVLLGLCALMVCLTFTQTSILLLIFYMELVSLLIVPLICNEGFKRLRNGYEGLILYFIVSSLSGIMMLLGWLSTVYLLLVAGLLIKFGAFPFCWWVYVVYSSVSWNILIILNTLYKVPLLVICFLTGCFATPLKNVFFLLTVLLCWYFLVYYNTGWYGFIGGNSIVSSFLFLYLLETNSHDWFFLYIFVSWVYIFILLRYIFLHEARETINSDYSGQSSINVLFLFLSLPFSLTVVYKIFSLSIFLVGSLYSGLVIWCAYGVIEQIWLLNVFYQTSTFSGNAELVSRLS
uniref:NADH dehydrogenase subunit 2 n=1 Tax=Hexostoma thynni TaxID=92220 RepID=UPI002238791E|nr:NADH dehydrogenase subunit 2 [Hexostoma thynni]UYC28904.1 NADH dehydrogenase subunit 2 [Hexostoma thynni]